MENLKGLTNEEVKERIEKGQVNSSNTNNLKSNWQIVRDNVCTLFNLFNLIIAIALACVHAYTNMVFILIIIVNVLIGIIQEIHGKNLVKQLSILTTAKTKVIRDGEEKELNINEIVVDDVILLAQGDQIPSDAFVIDGEVEVNEALLTGESDTILKKKEDKLLSGSYVVSGKCYAKIEKVMKEYFKEYLDYYHEVEENDYIAIYNMVTADFLTYHTDDLPKLLNALDMYHEKANHGLEGMIKLLNKDEIEHRFIEADIDYYHLDFYKELMILDSDEEILSEWKNYKEENNEKMEYVKGMIEILANNMEEWYVEEETLYFTNDTLLEEYNTYYYLTFDDENTLESVDM